MINLELRSALFTRVANLSLRGLTLVSKFALIFLLAYYLEPVEVGLYGLLTATILFAIYPLGFDFYTFTTREIIATPKDQWLGLLKNQAVLFGLLYCIFLPLFVLIFVWGLLPWYLAFFFFALLVTEHLGQELNRLLVAISHPLLAGVVLFVRSGLWVLILLLLLVFYEPSRQLEWVLSVWFIFGLLALIIASQPLFKLDRQALKRKIDWLWLKKGLKVAIPFLVATLAIRLVFTADRYFIEHLSGLEVVAAYVLFIGIANAMMSFLDAGVFVFYYPKMIKAVHEKNEVSFRKAFLKMTLQVVLACLIFILVSLVLIDHILVWLARPIYAEYLNFLPWLLLAFSFNALSMLPHYCLYSAKKDVAINISKIVACVIFFLAVFMLKGLGAFAVIYALTLSMMCLLFAKAIFWHFEKKYVFTHHRDMT